MFLIIGDDLDLSHFFLHSCEDAVKNQSFSQIVFRTRIPVNFFYQIVLKLNMHESLNELLKSLELTLDAPPNSETWKKLIQKLNDQALTREKEQSSFLNRIQNHIVATSQMASLSTMIGGVCHELNNPLAVIQMRSDQLLELTQSNDYEQELFLRGLTSIEASVKRMMGIISRLRHYAKTGDTEAPTDIVLSELVQSTIALCQDRFTTKGIRIEFECLKDSRMTGSSSVISQALIQLLNNALEASVANEAKWVRVELGKNENQSQISVINSGIADIKKSFLWTQPFFTTKDTNKHSGLGLTIAKGIIEEAGGELNFSIDQKEISTTTTLRLPASHSS